MRRGTIFILLFLLVAIGVIVASQFVRSQPPLEVTIAVDPLAQSWIQDAVKALNDSQPVVNGTRRVHFTVSSIEDLDVWSGQRKWTPTNHPDAWIATSSASVTYAQANGLPLVSTADSLARTPLIWGGYVSRVGVLTQEDAKPFDWEAVEEAAKAVSWSALKNGQADWHFIKLAFAQPDRKMAGLAALFSAVGAFADSATPAQNAVNAQAFRDWLKPILDAKPSFFVRGDAMGAMTSGPSTVEIAMLPETLFLNNLTALLTNDGSRFRLGYPAYQYQLNFPLVRWQDTQTTTDETAAVQVLGSWLAASAQQASLPKYGLRPVSGEPQPTDDLFAAAIPYGIQYTPDYGKAVQTPSLTDVQGLLQWVSANQ